MTPPIVHPLDVSFVLAVAAGAWIWPPLALVVAAGYFGLNAWLADHRKSPNEGAS